MALVKCPECGKEISDKARKCPHCGYPLNEEKQKSNEGDTVVEIQSDELEEPTIGVKEIEKNYKKEGKIPKKYINVSLVALIIVISSIVILVLIGKRIDITDINISKWRVESTGKYGDTYTGIVTSDEKNMFIAVIGNYEDTSYSPDFVVMESGKGTFETYEDEEDDPSIKYRPIGYMVGRKVDDSDFAEIDYEDTDYEDGSDTSSCTIEISLEMKRKVDGVLWVEMSNDSTNAIERNIMIPVVNGKGLSSQYLDDMPIKSRGVEINITPKYFCESEKLKDSDYEIETPFEIEKDEGEYLTLYSGNEELYFDKYEEGLLLYTNELLDGGNKGERGEVKKEVSYVKNSRCNLTTFCAVESGETVMTPKYDIQVIGYLGWEKYDK